MHPTTYRGGAVIDGEHMEAVLHLNSDSVRLSLASGQEVLCWPFESLTLEPTTKGTYQFQRQGESFTFTPAVDDGLDAEIRLRRTLPERSEPAPPGESSVTSPPGPTPVPAGTGGSTPRGRRSPLSRVFEGQDLGARTALALLALLAGIIMVVAALSGAFSSEPATVVVTSVADSDPSSSPPATSRDSAIASSEVTPAPEPTTASGSPPEVAGATVTTQSSPTSTLDTQPGDEGSAFELTPERFRAEWNSLLGSLSPSLTASEVSQSEEGIDFHSGEFMELRAVAGSDGTVREITLLGDPSGPVSADREILTALGSVVALAEPDLPPEGRRQLLDALGLDVEDPDLAGLDGELDYRGNSYSLRWDPEVERLVFTVTSPA